MYLEYLAELLPLYLLQDDLVLFVLRSTILLIFSLGAARIAKRASGQVHHLLWSMTFVALLLMVPLSMSLPGWSLAIIPTEAIGATTELGGEIELESDPAPLPESSSLIGPSLPTTLPPSGAEVLSRPARELSSLPIRLPILLWSFGAFLILASMLTSLAASRSLSRRSEQVTDPDWLRLTADIRRQLGIRREVSLRMSPDAISPMTGGWLFPQVLLPEVASEWSPEKRRTVLQHELVHVARHDVLRHLGVRLTLALYWFHPLAWLAARKARSARERACDEGVLALGARASTYATHLMELAEDLSRGPRPALALPIIESTPLEERLMAILKNRPGSRDLLASLAIASALFLVLFSVASAQPAPVPPEPPQPASPETVAEAPEAPPAPRAPALSATVPSASAAPAPRAVPAPAAIPQPAKAPRAPRADHMSQACWDSGSLRGSFRGTKMSQEGSYTRFVGFHDGDLAIQQDVLGARVCMRTHGDVELGEDRGRILGIGPGAWILLEAKSGGREQELLITEGMQHTWKVNGRERSFDAEAEAWRDQMLAVIGGMFRATWIRGQESSLRGKISSIHGERSSLNGKISSLHGEHSSLRGEISSIHGQRSTMQGEISSIRGHLSSLRGEISSHGGAISSLRADRNSDKDTAAAIARHEESIAELEREIERYDAERRVAEVERRIERLAVEEKVARIKTEIEDLDVAGRETAIEKEIEELAVEDRVMDIEREIEELDAEHRAREIERKLEPEKRTLKEVIDRIG